MVASNANDSRLAPAQSYAYRFLTERACFLYNVLSILNEEGAYTCGWMTIGRRST